MRNTLETRLGLFVALAVIAAVLILETLGGIEIFQRGYQLHALFKNIQDLKVGDRVKMAGVEIGKVEAFKLTNNTVLVTMKMKEGAEVKSDSVARVQFTGLMGQNFVSIEFGQPESSTLLAGMFVRTAEQPDIGAIMQKLENVASGVENLTKSFTGEKIDNLLGPFTDFLKANKEPLTASIANMQKISTQIAEGKGTVGRLIVDDALYTSTLSAVTNMQTIASDIQLTLGDARATILDARNAVAELNAGKGTLGKLLKDEGLYNETTTSMTTLKEILQKINQGQGTVGKLVTDQDLYKNAKLTLQKLDKATEGLEDQGPLSVMGMVMGTLF